MKNRNYLTLKNVIIGLLFIVISLFYTFLFIKPGNIRLLDSYDLLFHWNRISSLGNIFSSPVNFNYWNHVGNFTNIFYPWLTILPGYLIFQLAGSPFIGFLIFLTLITFLTLVSSYYFMHKFSTSTLQALLFAVLYSLSFFRLASVFYRVGLAEYLSYMFMPMVFYALAKILQGNFQKWPLLALGLGLIILTHPLTAFLVFIMIGVFVVLMLFTKFAHNWRYWGNLFLSAGKTLLLSALLSCGFIVPLLEQKKAINTNRPALLNLAQTAQDPLLLLKNSLQTDVRSYSLGIIAILAVITIVIFIWRDTTAYRLVAVAALLAIFLSTKLFPWQHLQDTFFNYLQFPWRFLNLANFFLAVYLSHIIRKIFQKSTGIMQLLAFSAVLGGCLTQVVLSSQQLFENTKPLAIVTLQNIQSKIYSFDQQDYYPQKSLSALATIKQHQFFVNGKKVHTFYHTTANTFNVKYYSQHPVKLDIPVLYYQGVEASINNIRQKVQNSARGTVQLRLQPGVNQIEISYHYTFLAQVSLLISLLALGWLLLLVVRSTKTINLNAGADNSE